MTEPFGPPVFDAARPKSWAFRRNADGSRPGLATFVESPKANLPPIVPRGGIVKHEVRAPRIPPLPQPVRRSE